MAPHSSSPDRDTSAQAETERAWVSRIRAGDAQAFEQLFRSYQLELRQFAYRYVDAWSVAEELVHDVFVAIWTRRAEWTVRDNVRSYLFSAIRNRALSHLRREFRERRWRASIDRGPIGDSERHTDNEAPKNLEREERAKIVRQVIAELPGRCREAVILRWQRQLSYAEIAEAMEISVKTVEIYLTRGAKLLRARYREVFPTE